MEAATFFETIGGNNYLYDSRVGSLIHVHPVMERIAQLYSSTEEDKEPEIARLNQDFPELSPEDLRFYHAKYLYLKKNGFFTEIDYGKRLSGKITAETVKTQLSNLDNLVFQVTNECNLQCRYCCYGELYENPKTEYKGPMSFDMAKKVIDFLVPYWNSSSSFSKNNIIGVGFYGGEPLLNFSLITQIISYLSQLQLKNTPKFAYNMTTNCMLLDRHMDYLVENEFSLLFSLDGNEIHDRLRVDKNNHSSFSRAYSNIKKFQAKYLTIYLNGDPLSEEGSFCRQFIWSCPGGPVLDSDKLAKIAKQIESTRVVDFNIVTSDLFAYPYLKELFLLLETSSLNTTFYLPYKSLAGRKVDKELFPKEHIQLCILVDSPEEIDNIDMSVFSEYNVQFFFKIVSVDEYMAAADRIARYNLKAKILPYYNGDNYSFFEEQIFLDKEDILNTQWTKQQIFAHQVINTKDFGKFTVLPTGKIYGNINFEAVGTVEDDMKELVYKEMKNGSSWRRVRSLQKKCGACLYRYLCPSPSNYELCIGKDNLCHLYSEKDI